MYLSVVFDDGPAELMCAMTDKIASYGWTAGYAVIGKKITDETLPYLQYVVEKGFELVSHGQEHVHVEQLPTREAMVEELMTPVHTLKERMNYTVKYARLPFISFNDTVLDVAKNLNLPLLGHGIDGGNDWDVNSDPAFVANAVLSSVSDGAVACLHVRGSTYTALDTILPELKKRGYTLVTPTELFALKGVTPPLGINIHKV